MADFDKIIRNGTIVDGTGGTPAFRGDIAIRNGKIAMISGNIQGSATEELDATGCIVAPGAIDLHTHYDLQLNWEPYATMSGWHGVTSVTIGQCGFGFAPCKPGDREAAMRLMTRIEAIPLRTMELGLRWDWETFPQWMDSLDNNPLGVNVGALVPFNTLRMYVMGLEDSRTVVRASDEQIRQMQELQREAMRAGAFGWSAMKTLANRPDDGRFIPSQVAHNDEFLALAKVLNEFGVGHIGWTRGPAERPLPPGEPDLIGGGDPGAVVAAVTGQSAILMDAVEGDAPGKGREDFLIEMTLASGRPIQWGAVSFNENAPGRYKEQLAFLERARQEGAPMFAQTTSYSPSPVFELAEYNGFDAMPNWIDPFVGTPEERNRQVEYAREPGQDASGRGGLRGGGRRSRCGFRMVQDAGGGGPRGPQPAIRGQDHRRVGRDDGQAPHGRHARPGYRRRAAHRVHLRLGPGDRPAGGVGDPEPSHTPTLACRTAALTPGTRPWAPGRST